MQEPAERSDDGAPAAVVALVGERTVREELQRGLEAHRVTFVDGPDSLAEAVAAAAPAPVIAAIDTRSGATAADAMARLGRLSVSPLIWCLEGTGPVLDGTDILASATVAEHVAAIAGGQRAGAQNQTRLAQVTSLGSQLDAALETASDDLAAGFGVARCLISVSGDSTGGAATGDRTWASGDWSETASRCRAAARSSTTVIAAAVGEAAGCESYLAAPLATPLGMEGFVGLIAAGPRLFLPAERALLTTIADRLAGELAWRAVHERAVAELDRLAHGPGIDPVLGIWNRAALDQLASMQHAAARRAGMALTAVVLDVVDLQGINVRHGLKTGDAVLRRMAEAVRVSVREEDVVGRFAGDEIAILAHTTGTASPRRVAERLASSLDARPIELPGGGAVKLSASLGVAAIADRERPEELMARAARAAKVAQQTGQQIAVDGQDSGPGTAPGVEAERTEPLSTLGGTYRLLHEISRGGMGVVYRAQDLSLERPVAIKMLRPELAEDPALAEKFRAEATMLAHIQHPNLVQIFSFGESGGDSYFVMELCEGESLAQAFERCQLEGTRLSVARLCAVAEQISAALDALHERGIVHRDVKPANVILDPFRGRSVLVDVGIARRHSQRTQAAGTPGYIAPEVVAGDDATAAADIYGLASTLYAMLTMKPPWGQGAVTDVLARQRAGGLVPVSEVRPELAPVDDILARALDSDPRQRPAVAGEFAREFAEACRAAGALSPSLADEPERASESAPATEAEKSASTAALATTRGVVFRSVVRALGVRAAERLRDRIASDHPDIARTLAQDTAPLSWLPTSLFVQLVDVAARKLEREPATLAADIARAAVRASFRRFFPASAATLVPERTLSAIRGIWGRYQRGGEISALPVKATEVVVRITDTLREPILCAFASGLIAQLVVLSGGASTEVTHEACECRGDDACLFRVTWG